MKKIETYETFRTFYLKTFSWLNSNENKEKILLQEFKENIMLQTNDEYIILLNKKPKIDRELWYDDETPRPEITLEYFKSYNSMNFKYDFTDYLKNKEKLLNEGFCSGLYTQKLLLIGQKGSLCGVSCLDREKGYNYFIRELTEEEENIYLNICEELKQLYDERLEKYFKKYKNKIYTRGYWVNR